MDDDVKTFVSVLQKSHDILRDKFNVKEIGIFGSVARGEHTAASDIDVLVEFSKPIGLFTFLDLESFLQKQLSHKIDLVSKKALKPVIKDQILKDVVYA